MLKMGDIVAGSVVVESIVVGSVVFGFLLLLNYMGLFTYYVSLIRGSWIPPPPSVSNGQHLAYARCPFCTTIFYGDIWEDLKEKKRFLSGIARM